MKPLIIALLCSVCSLASAQMTRSIKVTAKSEIVVDPDEVVLGLEIRTSNKDLLVAKRDNDKITAAVLALVPKHSIPAENVEVARLDVSPYYGDYRNRQMKPVAYLFSRSIQIRLTEFTKIEPLLDEAFDAGLSGVSGLHFRVSNQRQHQFDARRLAVNYAREKAEHLTELTGMKLGLPIRIEEGVEHNPDAGGFGGFGGGGLGANLQKREPAKQVAADERPFAFAAHQVTQPSNGNQAAESALFAPRRIVIDAHVTVEFSMSPK